jgi:hypothetical protein
MFEEQLSQGIISFLEKEGYAPFLEIPHFSGKIDFTGIKSSECIVIESKVSKWKYALKQAIRYGYGADKAYVALPPPTSRYVAKNYGKKFDKYGIGLIEISDGNSIVLIDSTKNKPSPVFKKILLRQTTNRLQNSQYRVNQFVKRFSE